MTTSVPNETPVPAAEKAPAQSMELLRRVLRIGLVRELLIILAFCFLTSLVTWPYVTRMRDAVAGPGDPYLVSWMLWWDFHQTFKDPLNLFHGNVFYPYRYTLAFSETAYGVAFPFFPLFALGLRPLTVHAVAMFMGFALSGYAAFRLTRTLTGSNGAAWISGIVFAFIPYRFNMLAQLMYEFSVWLPLVFEALVLFVRIRSWRRAIWLGFTFFMLGLTTITWLMFALVPLAVITVILLTRHDIWSDRDFWKRSAVSLALAALALLPFTIPFYIVSKMYGFKRGIDDVKAHSAYPIHWLVAEGRSKIYHGMGDTFPEAWKFQLFPGLLPLLLPLAEVFRRSPVRTERPDNGSDTRSSWISRLDLITLFSLALSLIAIGFEGSDHLGEFVQAHFHSEYALGLLFLSGIVRLCLAYPAFLRGENKNLIETLRSTRRDDAFWIGMTLVVLGFLYSIGWNFFFYRLLYRLIPGFVSIRAPMRGSIFAYLGMAVLSGLGVKRLSTVITDKTRRVSGVAVYVIVAVLLLLEMNNAPLHFIRGEVFPDQVTLRLKNTPMRGGLMYFPAGTDFNQRYMLRAADHAKPLILGTSGFLPPNSILIEKMTDKGSIPYELMDLLEKIPASYLIVENKLMPEDRKEDYQQFLARAVRAGRLRFVNRFDQANDLYAVVKTEPEAKAEAALPFDLSIHDWAGTVRNDPATLLSQPLAWSQRLYRVHLATTGAMPGYKQFMSDLDEICRGIIVGSEDEDKEFAAKFNDFLNDWVKRDVFLKSFNHLDNTQFVDRLIANASLVLEPSKRQFLISELESKKETRASVLLRIVEDPQFVEKEKNRSIVALHYFGYLRRSPDDPPDGNLNGFNFWVQDVERWGPQKLATAFKMTDEYKQYEKKP